MNGFIRSNRMISFTKEEAMQNIDSLKELENVCNFLHDSQEFPFTVLDVKIMIGLLKHLAVAAGYVEEGE